MSRSSDDGKSALLQRCPVCSASICYIHIIIFLISAFKFILYVDIIVIVRFLVWHACLLCTFPFYLHRLNIHVIPLFLLLLLLLVIILLISVCGSDWNTSSRTESVNMNRKTQKMVFVMKQTNIWFLVEFIMSSMCPVSLWKTNSCKFMCILLINGYQASINYTRSPSLTSASPLWEAQKPVWGCRGQTADLCCSWSGLQEHQRAAWRQDETCVWDYSQTDGTVTGNSRTTLEDLLKDLQAAGTLPCSTHRYSCWSAHVHVKFVNEHMNDSDETNLSCLNGKERITASHWGKDRKS